MTLYQNFPKQCRLDLTTETGKKASDECNEQNTATAEVRIREDMAEAKTEVQECSFVPPGVLLNTQLIEHYGFEPSITLGGRTDHSGEMSAEDRRGFHF